MKIEKNASRLRYQIIFFSFISNIFRYMKQLYQNVMIIYRYYNQSDFFIIFIYNSKWNEIISNILTNSIIINYFDIISRVFNFKLKVLINDLFKKYIFEKIIINIYINIINKLNYIKDIKRK